MFARKSSEDDIPSTVYSLYNAIRNKFFNYENKVNNINTNDTRTYGIDISSCCCTNSKCLNHYHGHTITGDLRIIENKKRKIISKGPDYRETKIINLKKSKESIMEGLDIQIKEKFLSDKKISEESSIPWKSVISIKVDKKIKSLKLELNHLNPILFWNKLTS